MIVYFTEFTEKYSTAVATKIGIIGVTCSHALRLLVYFNYWFYAAGVVTCSIFQPFLTNKSKLTVTWFSQKNVPRATTIVTLFTNSMTVLGFAINGTWFTSFKKGDDK